MKNQKFLFTENHRNRSWKRTIISYPFWGGSMLKVHWESIYTENSSSLEDGWEVHEKRAEKIFELDEWDE